jgi:zinc transporter
MAVGRILDSGDLIAAFARMISKELDPEVSALGDELDECETDLEPRNAYKLRSRIAHIRSQAIGYRRFVAPDRDALVTLAQLDFDWLADDDRLHIREAADRFARMTEELEAVRERAALLHEQLTDMRGELIETRALLVAIVALIFLPLTFITGLFGMNVSDIPLSHGPHAFWGITAFCIVVALATAAYFWIRRWIG